MGVQQLTWVETGVTLYCRGRRKSDGTIWDTTGTPAWVTPVVLNIANYTLAAAETPAGSYSYLVTVPAGWAAGDYQLEWYRKVGANAAWTDILLAVTVFEWDGSAVIVNATNSRLYQQSARETNGVSGTVWHVKYAAGEDLTKDGLSWATAKETAGAGLKTVIETAAAGDLVLIGAGTFALTTNTISIPDGVSVRGAGIDSTRLTSTYAAATVAVVRPGNGTELSHFEINALLNDGTFQFPIGCAGVQPGFENVYIHHVHMIGDADNFYSGGTAPVSALLEDCIFESKFDCVAIFAVGDLMLRRCLLLAKGPSSTAVGKASGITILDSEVVLADCEILAQDGGAVSTIALSATDSTIIAQNCRLDASGAAGAVYCARNVGSGSIILIGCEYDRTKTSGTVTDKARIITDLAGNAYADAKLVKTVDADTAISARVDASTLAGKFAGITIVANWLRGLFRKDAMNAAAKGEVNAIHDGGAAGTFNETTDSLEAVREKADDLDADVEDVADQVTDVQNNTVAALARLGVWTGTGVNTILGAFRALANKAVGIATPTDISTGGTFTNTTDSAEALRDRGDAAWTTDPWSGDGDVAVDHAYDADGSGDADQLRIVDGAGAGVDAATIRAYLQTEYDAGLRSAKATAVTGSDGRWTAPMMLDADDYYLVVSKPGRIAAKVVEVTVA